LVVSSAGCAGSNILGTTPVDSRVIRLSLPTDEEGIVLIDQYEKGRPVTLDAQPLRIIGTPSEDVVFLYSPGGLTKLVVVDTKGELWGFELWNTDKRMLDPRRLPSGNYTFVAPGSGVYEINSSGDILGFADVPDPTVFQAQVIKSDLLFLVSPTRVYEYHLGDACEVWGWSPPDGSIVDVKRIEPDRFLVALQDPDMVVETNREGSILWTYGVMVLKDTYSVDRRGERFTYVSDGYGRVLEVFSNHNITWSFGSLGTDYPSTCRLLRNAHLLVTDRDNGRILEIKRSDNSIRFEVREISTMRALASARGSYG